MIQMSILLIPFILVLILAFIFLLINLFHVARFGLQSTRTTIVLAGYLGVFLLVSVVSVMIVFSQDWSGEIDVSGIFSPTTGQGVIGL